MSVKQVPAASLLRVYLLVVIVFLRVILIRLHAPKVEEVAGIFHPAPIPWAYPIDGKEVLMRPEVIALTLGARVHSPDSISAD
jgi:hypothetical protein